MLLRPVPERELFRRGPLSLSAALRRVWRKTNEEQVSVSFQKIVTFPTF